MSHSVQPHRWQPTRFLHPWDSSGKNTGVGCHFLLQCMKVKSEVAPSPMHESEKWSRSFSNAWKWKVKSLSRVWLFATPWTAAYQAPPSMGFSRQEYWSGLPLPSSICKFKLAQFILANLDLISVNYSTFAPFPPPFCVPLLSYMLYPYVINITVQYYSFALKYAFKN